MSQFFFHHFHTAHHHYDEYNQVFYTRSIRALAQSLVSIFIPIYLVQISNNSLEQALPLIGGFFIGQYLLRFALSPVGGMLTSRFGAKHVLNLSALFHALAFLALAYLDQYMWLLLPVILLEGINMALFFTSLHVDMSFAMQKRKGRQVSSVEIARKLTMAIGPLVGGVIAGTVGIYYGFIAAIAMLAVSTLPLKLNDEPTESKKHPFSWRDFRRVRPKIHLLANLGMGMNMVSANHLWPLFIYVLVGTYQEVGVIITLSLAFSIFVMRFIGLHDSSRDSQKQIKLGTAGTALTHVIRPVTTTITSITGINILNDITFSALVVPYMANYYKNADNTERIAYISMMEMAFGFGAALAWGLVLIVFIFLSATSALAVGFVVGAVGSLMAQLIKKQIG